MPHTYECPLRWADMDLLGHVNNVTYLEYVAEARADLFRGLPAAEATVRTHRVQFVSPLVFHRAPVLVDTWVTDVSDDEVTLAHEVYDATDGGRTTYLRAATVLAHRLDDAERALVEGLRGEGNAWSPLEVGEGRSRHHYPVTVRRSDVDAHDRVRDVLLFEYLQESRIQYLMDLHTRGQKWSHHVVARTDVDYLAPLPRREAPYDVHSWISHLGRRSFTISAEVRDGDRVLATGSVVMVTFDRETQRSTDMAESQRVRLERELAGSTR